MKTRGLTSAQSTWPGLCSASLQRSVQCWEGQDSYLASRPSSAGSHMGEFPQADQKLSSSPYHSW